MIFLKLILRKFRSSSVKTDINPFWKIRYPTGQLSDFQLEERHTYTILYMCMKKCVDCSLYLLYLFIQTLFSLF